MLLMELMEISVLEWMTAEIKLINKCLLTFIITKFKSTLALRITVVIETNPVCVCVRLYVFACLYFCLRVYASNTYTHV